MEELLKKLEQIKALIKSQEVPPSPKSPKPPAPSVPQMSKQPEAPKAGQATSKKDPKKVAEQLKDPGTKDSAMKEAKKIKEGVSFSTSGQWSLK